MVERLKEEGVGTVSTLDEMQDGTTVIIRSHGVGPSVYAQAEQRGLNLVDATCPHVKKAQLSAKQLSEEGYTVVIIGEKITRRSRVSSSGQHSGHTLLRARRRQRRCQPLGSSASSVRQRFRVIAFGASRLSCWKSRATSRSCGRSARRRICVSRRRWIWQSTWMQ